MSSLLISNLISERNIKFYQITKKEKVKEKDTLETLVS
jgi:hypothetical protein